MTLRIGIAGIAGRMGRLLSEEAVAAMACGGGKEQLAEPGDVASPPMPVATPALRA